MGNKQTSLFVRYLFSFCLGFFFKFFLKTLLCERSCRRLKKLFQTLIKTQGKMAITVTNGDKSLIYGGTINDRNSNNNGNHAHANTNNNGNGQQQQCCGGLPEEIDNTFVWTMVSIVIWLLIHFYIVNPACFTNTYFFLSNRNEGALGGKPDSAMNIIAY